MRALFTGLGSIGIRHLNNLCALCESRGIALEVTALRSGGRPLPEGAAGRVQRQLHALPPEERFDLAFITNPTRLHAVTLGKLAGRADTFFIEKPVFEHPHYDLRQLGLGPEQKAYVAAPMRWTALYLALKKWVESGAEVFSARAVCSSYLPEWRPKTDYRESYSAQKAMGGGVTLDLIHEWDYLYDLFGPPQFSCNLRGKYSGLEIDSDDLSVYVAQWPKLLGELHLDYFGREYRRRLELLCPQGALTADFASGRLTLPDGGETDFAEAANARYMREMEYFITYALGGRGESVNSPQKALEVLKIALGDTTWQNG
jgi:predicted dehydrogenase